MMMGIKLNKKCKVRRDEINPEGLKIPIYGEVTIDEYRNVVQIIQNKYGSRYKIDRLTYTDESVDELTLDEVK